MKRSKKFAGPPILPWFRTDSSRPLGPQLADARIVKCEDGLNFPELRLIGMKAKSKPKPRARAARKKKSRKSGR